MKWFGSTFVQIAVLLVIVGAGIYGMDKAEAALPRTEVRALCDIGTVTLYETGYVFASLHCPNVSSASQSWKKDDAKLRPGNSITCTVVTKKIPIINVNTKPQVVPDSCGLTA